MLFCDGLNIFGEPVQILKAEDHNYEHSDFVQKAGLRIVEDGIQISFVLARHVSLRDDFIFDILQLIDLPRSDLLEYSRSNLDVHIDLLFGFRHLRQLVDCQGEILTDVAHLRAWAFATDLVVLRFPLIERLINIGTSLMKASERIILQNGILTITEVQLININFPVVVLVLELIVFDAKIILDERQILPRMVEHHLDVLFSVE
jgi:hypothetical protein